MVKKRPANELDIKLHILKLAIDKANKLYKYILEEGLDYLESNGQVNIDSRVLYDVLEPLEKEKDKIYKKLESIYANNLLK
tara:strand:- start:574 stop:816 length:243 start_codon:yes stop_codon:yes gene_type:complete